MKLSVVIVNYNVEYFLEQCLYSVSRAMQGIEGEVFVVDNNSVDGSLKMLAQKFPEVKVIANKENVGFAKANNQAIRISKGEYVLLLNPDIEIHVPATKDYADKFMKEYNKYDLGDYQYIDFDRLVRDDGEIYIEYLYIKNPAGTRLYYYGE